MRCPTKVIERFVAWTQAEFVAAVDLFSDQFEPGDPGYGCTREFLWTFKADFSLQLFAGSRKEWVNWSAERKTAWISDYGPERQDQIEEYWIRKPWNSPVIAVQGTDGRFYVWDGNHRVGVAFTASLRTIPAIVGLRKSYPSQQSSVRHLRQSSEE